MAQLMYAYTMNKNEIAPVNVRIGDTYRRPGMPPYTVRDIRPGHGTITFLLRSESGANMSVRSDRCVGRFVR